MAKVRQAIVYLAKNIHPENSMLGGELQRRFLSVDNGLEKHCQKSGTRVIAG